MDLSGKRVLIIGLARTGLAAARFLAGHGAQVVVTEKKGMEELKVQASSLAERGATVLTGPHDPAILAGIDLVVPSPGVPPRNVILREASAAGIPVMSELELASRFLTRPVIAITGTNGKTTTTQLIGEMLRRGGRNVFVGGNIGNPLIGVAAADGAYEYLVIEVSSFQLQWSATFRPAVAVHLNLTPDHLDYHSSFDEYRAMKERIFACQGPEDRAILNQSDPALKALEGRLKGRIEWFSAKGPVLRGMHSQDDRLLYAGLPYEESYSIGKIFLKGNHNLENAMAAILSVRPLGCSPEVIGAVLEQFAGPPHRIEFVGEIDGASFYNDSKGTNVDAVLRALERFSGAIILLLGGRDKGGDFSVLRASLAAKVKQLVIFGEARYAIDRSLGSAEGLPSREMYPTLKEAMARSAEIMKPGDTVLLSPGCASFDEFSNYEARGDFFRSEVGRIAADRKGTIHGTQSV
ncbi:MAG: UDP-N-acetylmuramoyl-L-alanine--D-glutamate ligase [Deltaproteobacteria bacterium]|nr:UDP-N-acetylmuramoyl-L-alanine--D-glutamate ligase [Deltaproteobacteria bacterium]